MRVGQFVSFGIGGADKAAYCLTKGLIEAGVDVRIFYGGKSFPGVSPQVEGPLLSRYDQFKSLGVPMTLINNAFELNHHGLSILNTHRSGDDFWLIPNLERESVYFKIVETNFHGHLASRADMRVFPSHTMIANRDIPVPYRIIPNPIMCKLTDEDMRREFKLEGKFIFGSFGRPGSDIYSSTAIRAFKSVENDSMYFLYVAPHPLVVNDANALGLKNFRFVDATIDDVLLDKLYNTIDVLCHSNKMGETFGNTVAEAMIHAKPVISHLGYGWAQAQREVIGTSKLRYVCNDDPNEYSSLMINLFTDIIEYRDYSMYAKKRADELYDYRVVAKKYIELYKEIIG